MDPVIGWHPATVTAGMGRQLSLYFDVELAGLLQPNRGTFVEVCTSDHLPCKARSAYEPSPRCRWFHALRCLWEPLTVVARCRTDFQNTLVTDSNTSPLNIPGSIGVNTPFAVGGFDFVAHADQNQAKWCRAGSRAARLSTRTDYRYCTGTIRYAGERIFSDDPPAGNALSQSSSSPAVRSTRLQTQLNATKYSNSHTSKFGIYTTENAINAHISQTPLNYIMPVRSRSGPDDMKRHHRSSDHLLRRGPEIPSCRD